MVEATNKLIEGNLWRNLEERIGAWLEELPKVLWAQRTIKKRATNETPFTLVYKIEAILPTKVGLPTITTLVAKKCGRELKTIGQKSRSIGRSSRMCIDTKGYIIV